MSDISVEVLSRTEVIMLYVTLDNGNSLQITLSSHKAHNRGKILVTYDGPEWDNHDFYAKWKFNTDTTTHQFLAGYDTEALVDDLFKTYDDYDFPHDEKRYIANAIICACEKLENGEGDNG